MAIKLTNILILSTLLALACTMTYVTNPVRTETVGKLCASFSNRDQIVSSANTAEADQYRQMMKAGFSVTGNQLINTAIAKRDNPNSILEAYPNLPQELGMFVGPFVVGYVLLMFTCMCSCCCCCCPDCCPPCSCCRQEKNKPYSKCELIWPGIVLLLALGLILAAGAIGLSKAKDLQTTIQSVGCSISVTLDDIINGNVTSTGHFFIGLRTLYNQVDTIKNGLGTVATQLNLVVPTGAVAIAIGTTGTAAKDGMGLFPSQGTNATRMTAFNYKTPFDSAGATATLPSNLPAELGSNNAADAGTPIYNAYVAIDTMVTSLGEISTGAQTLQTSISGGTFNTTLDGAKTAIGDIATTLEGGDAKFYDIYSQVSPIFPTMLTAVTGIYGGLVGIASVGALAALLLLICNFYKCRYLLYFTCVILVVVGFICFLLSIIISALIPVAYFGCDFLIFSLSSKANFNTNFGSYLDANLTSMVTVCLNGQSGDFLQAAALGSATATLTDLRNMVSNVNTFDAAALNTEIDNLWNPIKDLITDYSTGKNLDFTSPSDKAILQRISRASNYPGCSDTQFASDSWVPTAQPASSVACKISTPANLAQCPIGTNFATGGGGCAGCMDSSVVLDMISGTLVGSLQARYNNVDTDCNNFISDIGNTYLNYYFIKKTNYVPLVTAMGMEDTAITNFKTAITTLGTTVAGIKTNLQSTVNTITDPNYGIVAGLNCAIIGEDILLVLNTLCTNGFKLSFFIRLAFGIAGFGVLFSMWCASCTGVRHYRQQQCKSRATLEVKDITNETLEDIKPVSNNQPNSLPPNVHYY